MNKYKIKDLNGDIQTYKNRLETFVESQIKPIPKHFSREQSLYEFRQIWCLTPRQQGKTTSLAAMFDHKTDIYVGYNYHTVDSFKDRLFVFNKSLDFRYSLLKADNVNHLRGILKDTKRVFIDVGGPFCLEKPEILKLIKNKIKQFEAFTNEDVVYIIV